jgi:phage head maturation protease
MEVNKKEIRNLQTEFKVNTDDEKRTVEGYALLFDTPSDGLGFTEKIEKEVR